MTDLISQALAPILVQILAAILAGAGAVVAASARKYLGTKTEAIMREALHQALNSGADLAAGAGSPAEVAEAAVAYAKKSVPEAIAKLGASDGVLAQLALAKVKAKLGV